jgi:hypothetical protein
MALIATRVYEVRIVTTGDVPAPTESYVDGGAVDSATEYATDVEALSQTEGDVDAALEYAQDVDAINPAGGEILAAIEAAAEILSDLEGVPS